MRYIDWVLPLNVKNTLKKYFQKEVPIISVIEEEKSGNPLLLKNKNLNSSVNSQKKCYILACGPSINEMDLNFLKGEDCISVSNFFVHPLYKEIKPKYHVFAPSHQPITQDQYSSWIEEYSNNTLFETKLFLNLDDKYTADLVVEQSNINRVYYGLSNIIPEKFENIFLDAIFPKVQTVVHIAIYTALALGYKEICLLGIDHNWILNHGKSIHFYNEKSNKLVEKGYDEYSNVKWVDQFRSHLNLWELYISIQKYASRKNVKILNKTPNSLLDVFEK